MVYIFKRKYWLCFFDFLKEYNDDITYEFDMALNPQARITVTTMLKGFLITINPNVITRVTTLPLGIQCRKEDKANHMFAKKKIFLIDENPIDDKNGVKRESLPYPWDEVSCDILQYISCEGRLSVVYGYQLKLLHELRSRDTVPINQRLSVPYFISQSIIDMSEKVKQGNNQQ